MYTFILRFIYNYIFRLLKSGHQMKSNIHAVMERKLYTSILLILANVYNEWCPLYYTVGLRVLTISLQTLSVDLQIVGLLKLKPDNKFKSATNCDTRE